MKTKILIPIFILFVSGVCPGQTLSTKEAKVVLVVDSESEIVTHIILFTTMQKMDKAHLSERNKGCKFYVGLLQGIYVVKDNYIEPKENTTIIMYTAKQIFPEDYFFPADKLLPGDRFDLGKIKAEVVSSKKGELILKT